MNKTIILLVGIVIVLVGFGAYMFINQPSDISFEAEKESITPIARDEQVKTPAETPQQEDKSKTVIGKSVDGRDLIAYHYGNGPKEVLFVGGIHGGYEWNTVLVAYELMNYLTQNPGIIPTNVSVTVIPLLNPDGLHAVDGLSGLFTPTSGGLSRDEIKKLSAEELVSARFNQNNVDLNRNFDCDWQATGKWQDKDVSGGTSAFSEPESKAINEYVTSHTLSAAVIWYSAAGGVYSSNCHAGVSKETSVLTDIYAKASEYPPYDNFDFYATTGDMTNWLAKNNIPAISVLLTNHEDSEWQKNQAGVVAILKHFAQ